METCILAGCPKSQIQNFPDDANMEVGITAQIRVTASVGRRKPAREGMRLASIQAPLIDTQ